LIYFPYPAILSRLPIVNIKTLQPTYARCSGEPDLQTEYSEEQLIRAAQSGDRDAFAHLYEANVEQVYQYLLRKTGQPADAEDITAEVFIRAMRALPSFEIRGAPFIAWLLRIAHNISINYLKQRSRRKEMFLQDLSVASYDDPVDLALQRVAFDEISIEMETLTNLQRQVLDLRFLRQLSIAETADQMSRSEKAVKFLQHSALRALRRRLNGKENHDDDR
jgi:RNA polymerase sigma-70 factor (ECF subfamily)